MRYPSNAYLRGFFMHLKLSHNELGQKMMRALRDVLYLNQTTISPMLAQLICEQMIMYGDLFKENHSYALESLSYEIKYIFGKAKIDNTFTKTFLILTYDTCLSDFSTEVIWMRLEQYVMTISAMKESVEEPVQVLSSDTDDQPISISSQSSVSNSQRSVGV